MVTILKMHKILAAFFILILVPTSYIAAEFYELEEFKPKSENVINSWPIEELENYFNSISIIDESIELNNHLTIGNPSKFISSHLSIIKSNNGNPTFKPYYDSLIELKNLLTSENT